MEINTYNVRLDARHGQRLFPADRPGKVADHARTRLTFMRRRFESTAEQLVLTMLNVLCIMLYNVCNARNIGKCMRGVRKQSRARIVLDGPAISCAHLYFKASG